MVSNSCLVNKYAFDLTAPVTENCTCTTSDVFGVPNVFVVSAEPTLNTSL
jgi:hypothetical protein